MSLNPLSPAEDEDKKPDLSNIFNQYREERKRKAESNKNEPKMKIEKSEFVPIFSWKHFLTSAPLEEEKDENQAVKNENTSEETNDIELEEDGTIKDVEVPIDIEMEYHRWSRIQSERKYDSSEEFDKIVTKRTAKPDINRKALESLFGKIESPLNMKEETSASSNLSDIKKKMTNCEFCDVNLKEINLHKHHRKCPAKLGLQMKKKS